MLTVVRHKSGAVKIDDQFTFLNMQFVFENKRCGSNKTFLLVMRLFICAPNLRSAKGDAARTRKRSASS
jgi:hypothetical protein